MDAINLSFRVGVSEDGSIEISYDHIEDEYGGLGRIREKRIRPLVRRRSRFGGSKEEKLGACQAIENFKEEVENGHGAGIKRIDIYRKDVEYHMSVNSGRSINQHSGSKKLQEAMGVFDSHTLFGTPLYASILTLQQFNENGYQIDVRIND